MADVWAQLGARGTRVSWDWVTALTAAAVLSDGGTGPPGLWQEMPPQQCQLVPHPYPGAHLPPGPASVSHRAGGSLVP